MTVNKEIQQQKRMGLVMQAIAWLVLLALLGFYFDDLLGSRHNPNQELETTQLHNGAREVVLKRNRQGHYVTAGSINGIAVTFLLDTGATGVAIPQRVAQQLKLQPGRAYNSQTANGVATSYAVKLANVSVGEITLHNVSAGIVPGLQTREILLGMSFLKHIEFTQRGDTLILRQHP